MVPHCTSFPNVHLVPKLPFGNAPVHIVPKRFFENAPLAKLPRRRLSVELQPVDNWIMGRRICDAAHRLPFPHGPT